MGRALAEQVRAEFQEKWVSAGLQPTDQPAAKGETGPKAEATPAAAGAAAEPVAAEGGSSRHAARNTDLCVTLAVLHLGAKLPECVQLCRG